MNELEKWNVEMYLADLDMYYSNAGLIRYQTIIVESMGSYFIKRLNRYNKILIEGNY